MYCAKKTRDEYTLFSLTSRRKKQLKPVNLKRLISEPKKVTVVLCWVGQGHNNCLWVRTNNNRNFAVSDTAFRWLSSILQHWVIIQRKCIEVRVSPLLSLANPELARFSSRYFSGEIGSIRFLFDECKGGLKWRGEWIYRSILDNLVPNMTGLINFNFGIFMYDFQMFF